MPIILDGTTPLASPGFNGHTQGEYRRRLGDGAGYSILTTTTGLANLAQQVVCSDFLSTELESSFLGNTWIYFPLGPNAGQCRRIQYQGLDPSTGTVTLESPLPNITQGATPIEIYGRIPPVRREGRLGLNEMVNRVLAECWTVMRLPLPGVQDAKLYPLGTAFPWLVSDDQLVEVYYRPQNEDPNADDSLMYNWRWIAGADNPQLEIAMALNAGDTLLVEMFVPMSWWTGILNTTTNQYTWGIPAVPGLHSETDAGLISLTGMQAVGMPWVYDDLSEWGVAEDQASFRQQRSSARAAANQYKRLSLLHPQRRTNHWPSVMTVRSRDNYGQGYTVLTPG